MIVIIFFRRNILDCVLGCKPWPRRFYPEAGSLYSELNNTLKSIQRVVIHTTYEDSKYIYLDAKRKLDLFNYKRIKWKLIVFKISQIHRFYLYLVLSESSIFS